MATNGRRPRPTADKELEGYRSDRINRDEPRPSVEMVRPPESLDADALAVWVRLAPDMTKRGVLTEWDVDQFATVCTAVAHLDRLREVLDVEGDMVTTTNGDLKTHPALSAYARYSDMLTRVGSRFGMTPSDRAALSVTPPEREPDAASPARFF